MIIPLVLGGLLITKVFPQLAPLGSPVMAFMVGVGAATIIGGALLGTLFPQVMATVDLFDQNALIQTGGQAVSVLINNALILFGLVATLASFQFSTRFSRNPAAQSIWKLVFSIGRVFIAIALGVIFSGVLIASLTALVERFSFMTDFTRTLFSGL